MILQLTNKDKTTKQKQEKKLKSDHAESHGTTIQRK